MCVLFTRFALFIVKRTAKMKKMQKTFDLFFADSNIRIRNGEVAEWLKARPC